MYCPKCGQEIVSFDLRFCPRCGFALGGVAGLLASDGAPKQQATGLTIFRRKEYRLSAQLVFFSIISIPLAIIASIIFDSPGPLAIPLLMFLAGLSKLAYTFLFGKRPSALNAGTPNRMPYSNPALLDEPRAYVSPLDVPGRATTTELIPPPSVTEKTTNLLKDKS
jgi:hypothetical protein